MKVFYLSFFLLSCHFIIYAQLGGTSEVSILSPKAASIIKYGEHPVSLFTGLVDISVPVYTIEAHGFSVPIAFKYHASGLKFDDVAGEVGLGWTLMAGGIVTQNYRGAPDGLYGTFSRDVNTFVTCNTSSPQDNEYVRLRYVNNGANGTASNAERLDGEIDMYSFSFLDHSGSFCFPFLNSEVTGTAPSTGLFIPASGMKATRGNNQKLEIVDTDGIYYKFEVKDFDQNQGHKEYYLTQIISADKADVVDFIYDDMSNSANYIRRPFINYTSSVTQYTQIHSGIPPLGRAYASENGGIFYQSLRPPRLSRINFRGGHLTFDYAVAPTGVQTWDLRQVNLYNNVQSTPLQTVALTKGNFDNGEQRLDKVTFTNTEQETYDYQFGYFLQPADIDQSPGIDYWGYFNGSIVPYGKRYAPIVFNSHTLMYTGTNRQASEINGQRGILNKIIYPTKGYSEFVYEGHQAKYSLSQPVQTFGGVRIKEITNYLADGSMVEKKWYRYGDLIDTNSDGVPDKESGYGSTGIFLTPSCEDFIAETRTLVSSWPGDGPEQLDDLKTTTTYLTFPRVSYFQSGSSVVYNRVTEYVGNGVLNPTTGVRLDEDYGRTIYAYESMPDDQLYTQDYTYRLYSVNQAKRTYPWRNGNLVSKVVQRKNGSTYSTVSSIQNTYADINAADFRNVRVLPNVEFEYHYSNGSPPDIKTAFCNYPEYRQYFGGNGPNLCPYDYFNYYTTTAQRVVTAAEETTDGVTTSTVYNTYNAYGLPTSITRTNSRAESINTTLTYAADYNYSPYTSMKAANMLTPVVYKSISKNGSFMKSESTSYSAWFGYVYAPYSYGEQYQNGNGETEQGFNFSNKGNLQNVVVRGKSKSVYLWGYNNRYPIAHIENATWDQIYAILGSTFIDRVAQADSPAAADLATINNLRTNTNLSGAVISTYTYIPLIGMITQTDPNGITTYFESDSFGRLKDVKDNDGNIVEAYKYRYKQ